MESKNLIPVASEEIHMFLGKSILDTNYQSYFL